MATTLRLVRVSPGGVFHLAGWEGCVSLSRQDPLESFEVTAGSKIAATLIAEAGGSDLCKACFRYRGRVTPAVAKDVAEAIGFKMPGAFFVLQPNPTVTEMLVLGQILGMSDDEIWTKYLKWRSVSPGVKQILRGL